MDLLAQARGIGRQLMKAVLDRANGAAGVRLLQDAFNMGSIALYASLRFEVREPVLVMTGRPSAELPAGVTVRPMGAQDIEASDALCIRVHGVSRHGDLAAALGMSGPHVAEREGRITAHLRALGFWIANHGVAEFEEDMRAVIAGAAAATAAPVSYLLPTRRRRSSAGVSMWQ